MDPYVAAQNTFDYTPFLPGIGVGLVGYLIVAFLLYLVAKRLNNKDAIWAFVPLLNIFLFFELASMSAILGVLSLFVPLLNVIVILWAWAKILKRLNRSEWECILVLIPFVNVIYAIYLIIKLS